MKTKICTSPSLVPMALILGSIVVLSVMGLVFCWVCPDMLHGVGGDASRWYFKRQVVWNVVGIAAFYTATVIGWKRWLNVAPFLFEGWVALWFAAHMQQSVDGSSAIVQIGPISLDVWTLFPVSLALLVAWLRERYGIRTRRILFIVGIAAFAVTACYLVTDTNRMTRLVAFFAGDSSPAMSPSACARGFVQSQTHKAMTQAQWFSSTDAEILRNIPGNTTYSMPASSAVLFGKWFMSVAAGFFALFALGLVCLWRKTEDGAKRAFLLVSGLGIIVPAILGHCECLGLMPMLYTNVPLVSNDTTAMLVSWLGAGILVSAVIDTGEFVWTRADYLEQSGNSLNKLKSNFEVRG